jgi:hypothetical protein
MSSKPSAHTDPSGLFGIAGTVAAALIAFAIAFGVPLTAEQTEATLGLVAVAGPAWTAYAIRRHAFSPKAVEDATAMAHELGRSRGQQEM